MTRRLGRARICTSLPTGICLAGIDGRAHCYARPGIRVKPVVAGPSIAALCPPRVGLPCAILPRPRERQAAGWLLHCPLRVGGREIKICSAPLSEQHSSAGLDAAAQRRKKGRKCLFRRFPGKPGRPGGKRLLGRRTSISGPATTERGSLRAHLAERIFDRGNHLGRGHPPTRVRGAKKNRPCGRRPAPCPPGLIGE